MKLWLNNNTIVLEEKKLEYSLGSSESSLFSNWLFCPNFCQLPNKHDI